MAAVGILEDQTLEVREDKVLTGSSSRKSPGLGSSDSSSSSSKGLGVVTSIRRRAGTTEVDGMRETSHNNSLHPMALIRNPRYSPEVLTCAVASQALEREGRTEMR